MYEIYGKHPFEPSRLNDRFLDSCRTFSEYAEKMREIIAQTHSNLEAKDRVMLATLNGPQEFIPQPGTYTKKIGVLLIHGLLHTPYSMVNLFDYFKAQNYYVRSLLLPGHGTVVGDLTRVDHNAWIKATRFAMNSFAKEVDHLFILGMSTGGTLALLESIENPPDYLRGLILMAPALKIQNGLAPLSVYLSALGRYIPRLRWVERHAEIDPYRYLSLPYNAVAQVYLLTQRLKKKLAEHSIKHPFFVIGTADDEVISMRSLFELFQEQRLWNPHNKFLLYTKYPEAKKMTQIEQRQSHFSEQRIIDFSHNCLPVAPEHPHFGEHGHYFDLLHYQSFFRRIFQKSALYPLHYGSISWSNAIKYRLGRLSYNPDFYYLKQELTKFIEVILNNHENALSKASNN